MARTLDADAVATAIGAYRRGDVSTAEPLLERAVSAAPEAAYLHLYLAFCRTKTGDRRAFESYRRAAELAPQDSEMHYQLGLALSDDGQFGDAAKALERAVNLRPDWTDARLAWCYALERSGNGELARAELDHAVKLDPEEPRAYLARAQCHYRAKRFAFALGDAQETVRYAREDGLAHLWLGAALLANGKNADATQSFNDALALDPDLPQSEDFKDLPAEVAELVKKLPVPAADDGKLDDVSKKVEKSALTPAGEKRSATARRKPAVPAPAAVPKSLYHVWGAAAVGAADRAAEVSELVRSGNSAHDAGEDEEAIETLKHAVELDPNSIPAQLGLGIALYTKGEREPSMTALAKVLELDTKNAQAHYYMGANQGDAGNHDQAIAQYREALRLQPDHVQALVGLGISLSEKGLHEEAMASYREAIQKDPNYPEAHYHLGVSLSSADRDPEAIVELKAAIRLDPSYSDPHYTLGVIYHNTNKNTEALKEYQLLRDLDDNLAHELYRTIYPE